MTQAAVLSKQQQKVSLLGKKTKTKETVRNVLATPYAKYWPLIKNQNVLIVHDVLKNHLPKLVETKPNIPWSELKKMSRPERKVALKQLSSQIVDNREGLIFGVNDTTKALENNTIMKGVLIADDVQPRMMVEHVIDQCVLLRVPVLVVPQLKSLLKEACGFSSVALAFTDSPKYLEIHKVISKVSTQHPVPRNHINFQRSLSLLNASTIEVEDSFQDSTLQQPAEESSKSVYLFRNSKSERVFNVEKSDKDLSSNEDIVSGFISFSNALSEKREYKSLKVKKVKGDLNRNKRKIEDIKKRKNKKKKKVQ